MLEALTQAMLEYAQAIRGDWNEFDERSEKNIIERWVDEIRNPTTQTIEQWRDDLGICPDGNGHWSGFKWGHCRREDCPISYAREYADD